MINKREVLEVWENEGEWEEWITSWPEDLVREAKRLSKKEDVDINVALKACIGSKHNAMMLDLRNSLNNVLHEISYELNEIRSKNI
jgi:hypothetical protein